MSAPSASSSQLAAAVIPARFASQRLPGKALLRDTGKYLVQHVHERVLRARSVDTVILATDDERILRAAESFGARAVMTSDRHLSGTDRIAEAAAALHHGIILNVQGDEPEVDPEALDQLVEMMRSEPDIPMTTLAFPVATPEAFSNPSVVKVVVDARGNALYFSRSPIPFNRTVGVPMSAWPVQPLHHMGLYGFRRAFLQKFVQLPTGRLEQLERLEQLRALEHGYRIRVGLRPRGHPGIDTPEEYRAFVERCIRSPGNPS
ncbi:MAG: 3-deoxy-manno-octulosonate cytidylyltransferase [Planctomycetes bacterium]|nr:3-deoxy-manno-octulosonate cytidylyltransferase [Planctomycetota bacterium]